MTTQISGDSGVSKCKPGSVNQAALAANVAGNGPAFSVYQNVAQSITAASVKVLFQVEEFDTNNAFDIGANSRFQPQVPGYYQIIGNVVSNVAATNIIQIYKNGAPYKRGPYSNASPGAGSIALVYLNGTTDYVELFAYFGTASTTAIYPDYTYFQGYLVRAA